MTHNESALSIDTLKRLLSLDSNTGKLHWKHRDSSMFEGSEGRSAEHKARNWNSKMAGAEALASSKGNGYRHGAIFGATFLAHRVVYALANGRWPEHQVDHINGVPSDNRPENLRDATRIENSRNMQTSVRNTSGTVGVTFSKKESKWLATIVVEGKQRRVGAFAEFDLAAEARKRAEVEYGFHENHGRKAA